MTNSLSNRISLLLDSYTFRVKKKYLIQIFFLLLAIVLASRQLYVAFDDTSYINHFKGIYSFNANWISYLVDEPLWMYYTRLLGSIFSPEFALRTTLFFSSLAFLYYSHKIGQYSWIFIVLVFLLTFQLATELYFNQIRQGVALSLFLIGLSRSFKKGIYSSLIASAFHTSFLFVFISMVYAYITRKQRYWAILYIILYVIVAIFLSHGINDFQLYLELAGRRANTYEFQQKLNLNFYIIWVPVYFITVFTLKKYMKSEDDVLIWNFTFVFLVLVIGLTFVFEAASRLLYFLYIFIPLLIVKGFKYKVPKLIGIGWISFITIFNVYLYLKGQPALDTLFGRWKLILIGN